MTPRNHPYKGSKAVVLGLGRSGTAAARLLLSCGSEVTLCDSSDSLDLRQRAEALRKEGIAVFTGRSAETDLRKYELAVLSPGIEETSALVRNVTGKGTPLIGELELAFSLCRCPVVAITGTNGKTTTTEMTVRMLVGAGFRASACGNIGTPMSDLVVQDAPWDVLVAEVSSFQLETTRTFRPKVAAWLNLSPNHLDRYSSMSEYRDAKLRIFLNQTGEDQAVVPAGADLLPLKARKTTFGPAGSGADLTLLGTEILHRGQRILDLSETKSRGEHNGLNLMAALGCGMAFGADPSRMAEAVRDYAPPAHRCEFLGERRGIRWVNDSKATNLDALEQAIRSVKGKMVLIAGGKDKGFEFSPIAPLVRERVSFAVLIGEMRHRIARDWSPVPTEEAGSLEAAVEAAARRADPGSTVLFSPGTSSFDMFRDYVERGERFRQLVESLPARSPGSRNLSETASATPTPSLP